MLHCNTIFRRCAGKRGGDSAELVEDAEAAARIIPFDLAGSRGHDAAGAAFDTAVRADLYLS